MSESLFSSPREFRLWLYTIGHKTSLLRSVKSASMSALPPSTHESANRTAFSLSGGSLDSWVVSETWAWHEDDREYGDPSYFGVPQAAWDP